ncbi:MATE family efflux transporter [Paroceanicella profunda]|uniref:MATE family efflux transporter n=1 Tax=Paroceanicella profunda TaxID=2579971 RepID=A0A5B8G1B9_9RHOB|nr:MATE family efflux transporter [Paroceanicella profunda]QDL92263.1 MATE family efflux transporter [Paroceanicella profunda]
MTARLSPADITHARVLRIALPIALSNATVPILGAVDTGVVGQIGLAAPIGAVGIGAIILTSIYWVFGFLRMGTSGMVAQARGAGDVAETGALLTRALMVGGLAGLVFIAAQGPLFWAAFRVAPASDAVEGLARAYLSIRIWGAPATIALYAVTGWLIAMERTRAVLLLQVWMNGLNVGLDLWFVLGLDWGVEGVATATLIAEWTGLALGLFLCRAAFAGSQWCDWPRVFDRRRLRRMAAVNGDIMVRSVLLQASITSFLFLGADFGDVTLAANQILLQFLEITACALDGFAFAAEALVGQAMGARARAALRRGAWLSSLWGIGGALALALAFALGGSFVIDAMTTAAPVRAEARAYLPWAVLAPVVGILAWMFDGIFIGATRTRDMRMAAVWSSLIYAAALLALVPLFANHGLWAGLMVLNTARALTLWLRYPGLEREADTPPPAA